MPRPYGYSPFAYPPGTPTPEILMEAAGAQLMVNPHAPKTSVAAPSTEQVTGPRTIRNPYAAQPEIALATP